LSTGEKKDEILLIGETITKILLSEKTDDKLLPNGKTQDLKYCPLEIVEKHKMN
jgi:hypothetical protein